MYFANRRHVTRNDLQTNSGGGKGNAADCTPSTAYCNIRFWGISLRTCKQCVVSIEATTEDQNLYPGVQTVFEAAQNGTGGIALNPSRGRQTSIAPTHSHKCAAERPPPLGHSNGPKLRGHLFPVRGDGRLLITKGVAMLGNHTIFVPSSAATINEGSS
jgi:hypothetical protein